jgi:hypothetical protein
MSDSTPALPSPTADDRETRVQELVDRLRPCAEQHLRRMAERLVDLPEGQAFGQVEYDLRDAAHELAASSHQAGLEVGKKRGTAGPALSVPSAPPMPASSNTAPKVG